MASSFDFLKKPIGKPPVPAVPNKKSMNFVNHQSSFNYKRVLPLVIVLVIAVLVFFKFGILDQMQKKTDAINRLSQKQMQLSSLTGQLAEYDKLAAEYGRYSYGWMSEAEISTVDRLDVLDLVEEKIAKLATIENLAINNNVLTLNVRGITLTQAGDIVADLESSELVANASVYSASAESGQEASIFMSIVLTKGEQ